jgi:hypothetical protein
MAAELLDQQMRVARSRPVQGFDGNGIDRPSKIFN